MVRTDRADAAAVLAAAFHDDPMFVFIEPDSASRRTALRWFFAAACRLGHRFGRLDLDAGRAAAIWLPPGTRLGPPQLIGSGMIFAPLRLGRASFGRFVALTSAFEEAGSAAHGASYWHLFILGVAPVWQHQGVGGRLIAPVLAEADAAGEPCYLETLEESNLDFYRRHGFEVAAAERRPALPPFWTMVRRPAPAF